MTKKINRVIKANAISIHEFNKLLADWYLNSDETDIKISSEEVGVTPWIHIKDGGRIFNLNSDTKRTAVKKYLDEFCDEDWVIVENRNGRKNKVAFGEQEKNETIKGFYLYVSK
tara:strand:- start:776 stop:1117 length:342 start_codon:yes stop_codon:yes gene_type:complete